MPSYSILWKPSAIKELEGLSPELISKVLKSVEILAEDPFPASCRKIQGAEYSYRIRVGDYRVIYSVFKRELIIEIIRVRHRRDVYR